MKISSIAVTDRKLPRWTGEIFYAKDLEDSFSKRIRTWLDHLKIGTLVPDHKALKKKVIETGAQLRSAGDASFYGLADSSASICLVRPGDFVTVVHELTHLNPNFRGSIFCDEAGAFALGIYCGADFEGKLSLLFDSDHYSAKQKRSARFLCEAMLIMGRDAFKLAPELPATLSEVQLLEILKERTEAWKTKKIAAGTSGLNYLMEYHGLTGTVAKLLLQASGEDDESVIASTSQVKKDYLFAFKALTGFYHVNLGYELEEAVSLVEEHFRKEEAMTLTKTLNSGAKEMYALATEYGLPVPLVCALCEYILLNGTELAIDYADGAPDLLKLAGKLGRRGQELLRHSFLNPGLFDILTSGKFAAALLDMLKEEPDLTKCIISKIQELKFTYQIKESGGSDPFNDSINLRDGRFRSVTTDEKAKIIVSALCLASMPAQLLKLCGFDEGLCEYSGLCFFVDDVLLAPKDYPIQEMGFESSTELADHILRSFSETMEKAKLPTPEPIVPLDSKPKNEPWDCEHPPSKERLKQWWQDVQDGFMSKDEFFKRKEKLLLRNS